MIKPITFCGKVQIDKRIQESCRNDEVEKIQKFADSQNCDFFIYDKSQYKDNTGIYYTYMTRDGDLHIYEQIFDFKYPGKSTRKFTQMPPEYY